MTNSNSKKTVLVASVVAIVILTSSFLFVLILSSDSLEIVSVIVYDDHGTAASSQIVSKVMFPWMGAEVNQT
jgi:hypothetical protein